MLYDMRCRKCGKWNLQLDLSETGGSMECKYCGTETVNQKFSSKCSGIRLSLLDGKQCTMAGFVSQLHI